MPQSAIATAIFGSTMAPVAASAVACAILAQTASDPTTWGNLIERLGVATVVAGVAGYCLIKLVNASIKRSNEQADAAASQLLREYENRIASESSERERYIKMAAEHLETMKAVRLCMENVTDAIKGCPGRRS